MTRKRKAQVARTVKRAPIVRRSRVLVTPPRAIPWMEPRGVLELTARRCDVFAQVIEPMCEVARAQMRAGVKVTREPFTMHRRGCDIVLHHDGSMECSCIPLVLYVEAMA